MQLLHGNSLQEQALQKLALHLALLLQQCLRVMQSLAQLVLAQVVVQVLVLLVRQVLLVLVQVLCILELEVLVVQVLLVQLVLVVLLLLQSRFELKQFFFPKLL